MSINAPPEKNRITENNLCGKGFILSRRVFSRGQSQFIELWVATHSGPRRLVSAPQQSICFVKTADVAKVTALIDAQKLAVTIEEVDLKTLDQEPVSILRASQERILSQLKRQFPAASRVLYEADIKLVDRYLMERFAYGAIQFQASNQEKDGTLTAVKIRGCDYRPHLSSISIDIECDENENLFSVALAGAECNRVILMSSSTRSSARSSNSNYELVEVSNEQELLRQLEKAVCQADPDLLLGWNVKQFDLAVLQRRAERAGMALKLGRHNLPMKIREWDEGQVIVDVPGRSIIDGIEALKTMTWHFDSYALDEVATSLLGVGKLVQGADRLQEIKDLYYWQPDVLTDYNYQDCVLVNQIARKTRLIDFLMLRSTLTGLDMSRPGGSVAAFINVYLPKLHRANYISGIRPSHGGLASPGGYVMDSQPGLFNNVIVLDFKSLYPSIIRTFKIDPLGLAEGLLEPDTAIPGFKGAKFSRHRHFLPDIITNLWHQRDQAKKAKDAPRSQAIKILMNSFYGVLGSSGCPFYDPRLASSITMRGHQIMQITAQWVEESGYRVIYGDTDSIFVHLDKVTGRGEAKEAGLLLQKTINERWKKQLQEQFNLECYLEIEFETHFSRFFMPTIRGSEQGSKKRYAGVIETDAGSAMVFKGLENVRSDWTPLAKQFQETLYQYIFAGRPVDTFIRRQIEAIREGHEDDRLIYTKRLRKPLLNYTKTQPPHVKAALHADKRNQESGSALRYQKKTTIGYVMTTNGPQTPEHRSHPLDYEHYIEKQIRPIAESILPFVGLHFETIVSEQLGLF